MGPSNILTGAFFTGRKVLGAVPDLMVSLSYTSLSEGESIFLQVRLLHGGIPKRPETPGSTLRSAER